MNLRWLRSGFVSGADTVNFAVVADRRVVAPAASCFVCAVAFIMWSICVMSVQGVQAAEPPESAISQENIGLAYRSAQWPLGKQLALLSLGRTSLTKPVHVRLLRGTARASQGDYWALMRDGLAYRETIRGNPMLILTPHGRQEATELAWAWAKELRLHLLRRGENRYDCTARCSCGASFASRKSSTGSRNVGSQYGQHMIDVENGSWKPFNMSAFMAKIEARMAADADARAAERRRTG